MSEHIVLRAACYITDKCDIDCAFSVVLMFGSGWEVSQNLNQNWIADKTKQRKQTFENY